MSTKTCTMCGGSFPATSEYFNRDRTSRDGFYARCRECRKEYNRITYLSRRARLGKLTGSEKSGEKLCTILHDPDSVGGFHANAKFKCGEVPYMLLAGAFTPGTLLRLHGRRMIVSGSYRQYLTEEK